MPKRTTNTDETKDEEAAGFSGPRAILRVPEVLMALSVDHAGRSFADLSEAVGLPKSSLHRMLRTLESGGYVINSHGTYRLGPEAARLARMIDLSIPSQDLPGMARPFLQAAARKSGETVVLAVLDESRQNVFYIDVINSDAPLCVKVPRGNVRPLHSVSSGKAVLAFLTDEHLERYLETAPYEIFGPETTTREQLGEVLERARQEGAVFDRNGSLHGASGIAVPCFDASGAVRCALSILGPTDRIERSLAQLKAIALEAGAEISRALDYAGEYPRRENGATIGA